MTEDERLAVYLRHLKHRIDGEGFRRITPAQRRRLNHKARRHHRKQGTGNKVHLNGIQKP